MRFELPPSLWPAAFERATLRPWPPANRQEAALFIHRAGFAGLLPLLFAEIGRLPATLEEGLREMRAIGRALELRTEYLLQQQQRISEWLGGEPFAFLKGSDFSHRLYKGPHLRPMSDIDIFVPKERLEIVVDRLRAAGLRQGFPAGCHSRVPWHHELVFDLGELALEVHTAFAQPIRNRVDYDGIWTRRVPLETPHFKAWRLSNADTFAYHLFSIATGEFAIPMIRFVDLWLILQDDPSVVRPGLELSLSWQTARAAYSSVRHARGLFAELDRFGLSAACEEIIPRRERLFLDRWVLPRKWYRVEDERFSRLKRLWRKFWLMDNAGRRFSFAVSHLFAIFVGKILELRECPVSSPLSEKGMIPASPPDIDDGR